MKTKKEGKKCNFNCKKYLPIILAVIAVIIVIALVCVFSNKIEVVGGNTVSNIRNYGYTVSDGKWFYCVTPQEDGILMEIQRVKKGAKNKETIYTSMNSLYSLNVAGEYLYFIEIDTTTYYEQDDLRDNKIYRIKKDGSSEEPELLNDNDFNNSCAQIYVIDNNIYYIGTDSKMYKMDLNGQNRALVSDKVSDYLAVTDKYIIYDVSIEGVNAKLTKIMNIDGTNDREIINGKKLNTVAIVDEYIYYTNGDKEICKTKIDSGVEEVVYKVAAYNFNVADDGYIYFFSYENQKEQKYTICLFRVKVDGTSEEAELLAKLPQSSDFLNVMNGQAFYTEKDDLKSYIRMFDVKSKEMSSIFEYTKPEKTVQVEELVDETSGKYTAENPTGKTEEEKTEDAE